MRLMLEEIRLLEARIGQLECELAVVAQASPACQALISVPGIGLLTSTAMVAAVGDPRSFDSARRYASFLGLTRGSIPPATNAYWAASPSAAIVICACCSPTGRAL